MDEQVTLEDLERVESQRLKLGADSHKAFTKVFYDFMAAHPEYKGFIDVEWLQNHLRMLTKQFNRQHRVTLLVDLNDSDTADGYKIGDEVSVVFAYRGFVTVSPASGQSRMRVPQSDLRIEKRALLVGEEYEGDKS